MSTVNRTEKTSPPDDNKKAEQKRTETTNLTNISTDYLREMIIDYLNDAKNLFHCKKDIDTQTALKSIINIYKEIDNRNELAQQELKNIIIIKNILNEFNVLFSYK